MHISNHFVVHLGLLIQYCISITSQFKKRMGWGFLFVIGKNLQEILLFEKHVQNNKSAIIYVLFFKKKKKKERKKQIIHWFWLLYAFNISGRTYRKLETMETSGTGVGTLCTFVPLYLYKSYPLYLSSFFNI